MARYLDQVMETAGLYNAAGFNDDTRPFVAIPARRDFWRRASANWLAGLVVRGLIDMADAAEMAPDMANGLARRTYKLDRTWGTLGVMSCGMAAMDVALDNPKESNS